MGTSAGGVRWRRIGIWVGIWSWRAIWGVGVGVDSCRGIRGVGIDVGALGKSRRPLCKSCLDWSARRTHLAGSLGTAFLDRFYQLGWAKRQDQSRVVAFSEKGERQFMSSFPFEE